MILDQIEGPSAGRQKSLLNSPYTQLDEIVKKAKKGKAKAKATAQVSGNSVF